MRHLLRVFASGLVVVGDDVDGSAAEVLVVLGPPLARPHGAGGGHDADAGRAVYILLALDHQHATRQRSRHQVRQPVRNQSRTLDRVFPPAALGPPLAEVLGLEADHLVQQLPLLIDVVVGGDDLGLAVGVGRRRRRDAKMLGQLRHRFGEVPPAQPH